MYSLQSSCVFSGENPESVDFDPPALEDGSRINLPVSIMAGNRPQYLFRMLKSLRKVQGLNPDMVTVFIDGFFDEPASVARIFGLRVHQHEGVSKKNSRICQVMFADVIGNLFSLNKRNLQREGITLDTNSWVALSRS